MALAPIQRPPTRKRSAISMWDFSWLTRRDGNEAEYRDWDRVLDELADRGYDCVRIDAFPHLIADGDDEYTVLPEPYSAQWGNTRPVRVRPRDSLIEFIAKAKAREIQVALSTWFNPDKKRLRGKVRTPADYTRVWRAVLQLLADHGLDSQVAWVDLCNEFPLGAWARGAYREVFGASPDNPLPLFRRWSDAQLAALQRYFDDSIGPLREEFPLHRYTFSSQALAEKQLRQLSVASFDLLEPHVWLSDRWSFQIETGHLLSLIQAPGGPTLHAHAASKLFSLREDAWRRALEDRLSEVAGWAEAANLPLYSSEAWASTIYPETRNPEPWRWVKEICAFGVDCAIRLGWTGLCTSNFSQPHFRVIWEDAGWHRELCGAIRRA